MSSNPNHVEFAKLKSEVQDLRAEAAALTELVVGMNSTLNEILTVVGNVREQVGPTLDALSNSPMLKMLTGGK